MGVCKIMEKGCVFGLDHPQGTVVYRPHAPPFHIAAKGRGLCGLTANRSYFPAAALTMARSPARTWPGRSCHRTPISARSGSVTDPCGASAAWHGLPCETVPFPVPPVFAFLEVVTLSSVAGSALRTTDLEVRGSTPLRRANTKCPVSHCETGLFLFQGDL